MFYVETLTQRVNSISGWGFGEVIKPEKLRPHEWEKPPHEKDHSTSHTFGRNANQNKRYKKARWRLLAKFTIATT